MTLQWNAMAALVAAEQVSDGVDPLGPRVERHAGAAAGDRVHPLEHRLLVVGLELHAAREVARLQQRPGSGKAGCGLLERVGSGEVGCARGCTGRGSIGELGIRPAEGSRTLERARKTSCKKHPP